MLAWFSEHAGLQRAMLQMAFEKGRSSCITIRGMFIKGQASPLVVTCRLPRAPTTSIHLHSDCCARFHDNLRSKQNNVTPFHTCLQMGKKALV